MKNKKMSGGKKMGKECVSPKGMKSDYMPTSKKGKMDKKKKY